MSDMLGELSLHSVEPTPLHRMNQHPSRAWENQRVTWPGVPPLCPQQWNVKSSWFSSNAMLLFSLVSKECPYEGSYDSIMILSLNKTNISCKIDAFPQIQIFPNFSQIQKTMKFLISSTGGTDIHNPFPNLHSLPILHLPPLHCPLGFSKLSIVRQYTIFVFGLLFATTQFPHPRWNIS